MNAPIKRKQKSKASRAWAYIRRSKLKIFIPIVVIAGGLVFLFPNKHTGTGGRCRSEAGPSVNWMDCKKRMLMLSNSNFEQAKMAEADLSNSDFSGSNLKGADLTKAAIVRTSFSGADLSGAMLQKVEGYRSDFSAITGTKSVFTMAEMQRANFSGANLIDADFTKAELGRAIFAKAELGNSHFAMANLARATFKNARISGPVDFASAFLFLTRFEGVDLSQATGLKQDQIDLSCGDQKTKLPAGLVAPASWPCPED
ncbi:pentapeptide repeat-containing protein [Rhizobium helianthi]|uniref:Pentapeptide repeat-containing protein n=1 Tax=Rhizobium helianthi TaxID=1132695 RepID=A0ABW4M5P7_9HYPH